MRKGYNTIVRNPGRFIGHWADVTMLVRSGKDAAFLLCHFALKIVIFPRQARDKHS